MAVAITIRDVPDAVQDEIVARATRNGRSLQDFLLRQLITLAAQPSAGDVVARARTRARTTGTRLDPAQILAARDTDRR